MSDTEALAGQTFYRGMAAPSRPGYYSYIGLMNPLDSGITTFFDAFYPWPGFDDWSTEYGFIHYATPFNEAPFEDVSSTFLCCTRYGSPNSKTKLWLGTYPEQLEPQIDYIFQCAPSQAEPRHLKFPYPLIILPGDGIVFWSTYRGHENKAGVWLREKPLV